MGTGNDLEEAVRLHRDGRLEAAEAIYRASLAADPGLAGVAHLLGLALLERGLLEEACRWLQQAAAGSPETAAIHSDLGVALERMGRFAEAIEAYGRAAEKEPGQPSFRFNGGNALAAAGRIEEAIAAYRAALALDPGFAAAETALRRLLSSRVSQWHFDMLADDTRNRAYERAIAGLVTPASQVLEIGTGAGLLALLAARAGAARVVTCEAVAELAAIAGEIFAANQLADRISLHAVASQQLAIGRELDRPADLLLLEVFGADLLSEGLADTLDDAIGRLVPAGGAVLPRAATVYLQPVAAPQLQRTHEIGSVCGFDFAPLRRARQLGDLLFNIAHTEHRLLGPAVPLVTFDLGQRFPAPSVSALTLPCDRAGALSAILIFFELDLGPGGMLSTADPRHDNHWKQRIFVLPKPIEVAAGDRLCVTAGFDRSETFVRSVELAPAAAPG